MGKLGIDARKCDTAFALLPERTAGVLSAMRDEMALTLEDVVMRRTGIGQLGRPAPQIPDDVSRTMAGELGWSEARRVTEIASLDRWYRTQDAA